MNYLKKINKNFNFKEIWRVFRVVVSNLRNFVKNYKSFRILWFWRQKPWNLGWSSASFFLLNDFWFLRKTCQLILAHLKNIWPQWISPDVDTRRGKKIRKVRKKMGNVRKYRKCREIWGKFPPNFSLFPTFPGSVHAWEFLEKNLMPTTMTCHKNQDQEAMHLYSGSFWKSLEWGKNHWIKKNLNGSQREKINFLTSLNEPTVE